MNEIVDIEVAANLIPKGHANGKTLSQMMVVFSNQGWLDNIADPERKTREIISRVGIDYTVCNLQDGQGYFRPTANDVEAFRKWLAQEERRAKVLYKRIRKGKKVFEDFLKERCEEQKIDG